MGETNMDVDMVSLAARLLRLPNADRLAALRQAGVLLELQGVDAEEGVAIMLRRASEEGVLEAFDRAVPTFPDDVTRPPVGVPPRLVMVHQAVDAGEDPESYVRAEIDAALARGWRPTPQQQGDLHIDADGQPVPVVVPGNYVERPEQADESAAVPSPRALPVRRRNPPPKPLPPQHKRAEGLAIQFARTVLADRPPIGEWQRLDLPVSKSIVSTKAREFARSHNLKFRIRDDAVDPDDPRSATRPHLFCQRLADHVETVEVLP